MLGKLIKYEIKATSRIFLPLFLALLLFAVITRLIAPLGPEKWDTPAAISMAVYFIIMVGMFIMTFIMMIQRFYSNILGDEGYLMLTLPVQPWKHIVSKLLVSMLWIIASVKAAIISILIIALKQIDLSDITRYIHIFYQQIFKPLGASAFILSFEVILGFFVFLASSILIVFASISIGHLIRQHKILATFGAFIGLSTLSQMLFALISSTLTYFPNVQVPSNDFIGMQHIIQLAIAYGIFYTGLMSTAYFVITNYILSKRLNLE